MTQPDNPFAPDGGAHLSASTHTGPAHIANLVQREGVPVERGVPLSEFTTFRIGGPADCLVVAQTAEDIAKVLRVAREHGIPVRCIGGGSNLLVDDEGVSGIFVVNRVGSLRIDGTTVYAGGGVSWDDTVEFAVRHGLAGMSAMSGIPGTVGGAICGNAGAYGECVGDRLQSVTVVRPDGTRAQYDASALSFGYRTSALRRTGEVVVEAVFTLDRDDADRLREHRETILATRAQKLPAHDVPTAGSFFKNIDDTRDRKRLIEELDLPDTGHRIAAGLLLDRVGARGWVEGGAQVFDRHANIIVNRGAATSADVLRLSARMRERVRDAFGIELEPEVIHLTRRGHIETVASEVP